MAARKGHVQVILAILGSGADVNDRGNYGFTTLHLAAMKAQVNSTPVAWRVSARKNRWGRGGGAGVDAVDAPIEARADVELKWGDGESLFLSTAGFSNGKAMLALLQQGASLDARDNGGNTALHVVWKRPGGGRGSAALMGRGRNTLDDDGDTPADKLDVVQDDGVINRSTHDEIERTRLLLSSAPADRAWRRRAGRATLEES